MRWVADTGPLLHLAEVGALALLPMLGEVALPPAVRTELFQLRPAEVLPDTLRVVPLTDAAKAAAEDWCKAGLVHRGEAQAIALVRQTGADYLLTDGRCGTSARRDPWFASARIAGRDSLAGGSTTHCCG